MTRASPATLLRRMDEARRDFEASVGRCRDRFAEPATLGGWTVADLIHHVAAWDDVAADAIEALVKGRVPFAYAADIDAWNAAAATARRHLGEAPTLADLDTARRRFRDAVLAAPSDLWDASPVGDADGEPVSLRGIVAVWTEHDDEHRLELEVFLARAAGPGIETPRAEPGRSRW